MKNKRSFDKARAYHRKRCLRWVDWKGVTVWRFILNPGCQPVQYTTLYSAPLS